VITSPCPKGQGEISAKHSSPYLLSCFAGDKERRGGVAEHRRGGFMII